MIAVEITSENAGEYVSLIGNELCSSMERVYFRGIASMENDALAGVLIYELIHTESVETTEGRIRFLHGDTKALSFLLTEYEKRAREEGASISYFETVDEGLAQILRDNGFEVIEASDGILHITVGDLKELSVLLALEKNSTIRSIRDITSFQFHDMTKACCLKGNLELLDDLPYLPKSWYDQDVSVCSLKQPEVNGLFLVRKTEDNELHPMLLIAFGTMSNKNLIQMLAFSRKVAMDKYPDDMPLVINCQNSYTRALTDKLFPSCSNRRIYQAKRLIP